METSKITFYPVDNGGMTYIQFNDDNETTILIDMHIRSDADDDEIDDYYDVATHLRENLKKNSNDRPYVDYFILTHNDDDHIKGLKNHFHLGSVEDYEEPKGDDEAKIIINEMYGTSRIWKRASDDNKLCDDAKAFNKEMKRRVEKFQETDSIQEDGDRVTIVGLDPDGLTDDLTEIVAEINEKIILQENKLEIEILGPLEQQDDEEDNSFDNSNRNSIILRIIVTQQDYENEVLITGDTDTFVWEHMNENYTSEGLLDYDLMIAPHHCSRLSVGKVKDGNFEKSDDASNALKNYKVGAFIISSSKPIENNEGDPPDTDAKEIFEEFVGKDHFLCTEEYPKVKEVAPIIIQLTNNGPKLKSTKAKAKLQSSSEKAAGAVLGHGQ